MASPKCAVLSAPLGGGGGCSKMHQLSDLVDKRCYCLAGERAHVSQHRQKRNLEVPCFCGGSAALSESRGGWRAAAGLAKTRHAARQVLLALGSHLAPITTGVCSPSPLERYRCFRMCADLVARHRLLAPGKRVPVRTSARGATSSSAVDRWQSPPRRPRDSKLSRH